MEINVAGKSKENDDFNFKASIFKQLTPLQVISTTLFGISGGIFLRPKLMDLLVRRRMLSKKNYSVSQPILTNY